MFAQKTMIPRLVIGLGLTLAVNACGDGKTASVPPGLPEKDPAPVLISPNGAVDPGLLPISGGSGNGNGGGTQPTPAVGGLDMKTLNGTAWASTCYRFSDKGDYSKKFWSFAEGTMNSLLLKYKDDQCTTVSLTPGKPFGVWNISSIKSAPLYGDWSVITATCTSGNCSANIDVAFRVKGNEFHEGTKDTKNNSYFTDDGKFVAYTKADVSLDKLALDANGGTATTPTPSRPTTPTTPTPTTPTEPAADATGLGLLSALAGKTYSYCLPPSGTFTTSRKTSLAFIKGADASLDSYTSLAVTYQNADCTGEGKPSAIRTFTNLLVKTAPIDGWIQLEGRVCTSTSSCRAEKSLIRITDAGIDQAGEKSGQGAGTFFTETPRILKLEP